MSTLMKGDFPRKYFHQCLCELFFLYSPNMYIYFSDKVDICMSRYYQIYEYTDPVINGQDSAMQNCI